jgi:hypothetical protein
MRTFELNDDQRRYFTDVDNSILHHSVELGKLLLQEEALKSTLGTLYAARMKQMNAAMEGAGLDLQQCLGARVENGAVVVQVQDPPLTRPESDS